VYIFDLIEECKKGLEILNKLIDNINEVKIILGGGDGSVMTFVSSLGDHILQTGKCIFGIIPLGTGNDLSRALNFGGNYCTNNNNIIISFKYNS